MTIYALDRRILAASAGGLPLTPAPFAEVAGWLGVTEAAVLDRVTAKLQDHGVSSVAVAVAPNHYALGMPANGMSVWDIDDALAIVWVRSWGSAVCQPLLPAPAGATRLAL